MKSKSARLSLRYLIELSEGQKQMVSIAQALARVPQALLLDEPPANLDRQIHLEALDLLHSVTDGTEHDHAGLAALPQSCGPVRRPFCGDDRCGNIYARRCVFRVAPPVYCEIYIRSTPTCASMKMASLK
jgi:ABC-type antimicrobial peptide transport system ATPase subunit